MKINQNNLDKLKELAGKIAYTVKDTKKIARISTIDDGTAYDLYEEDTQELYEEVKADIVCIFVEKVTKETRVYTSGVEEVEEVEEDSYCHVSYTGDTKDIEEELTAEGYNVEVK